MADGQCSPHILWGLHAPTITHAKWSTTAIFNGQWLGMVDAIALTCIDHRPFIMLPDQPPISLRPLEQV